MHGAQSLCKARCDSQHAGGGGEVGRWGRTRETKVQVPADLGGEGTYHIPSGIRP